MNYVGSSLGKRTRTDVGVILRVISNDITKLKDIMFKLMIHNVYTSYLHLNVTVFEERKKKKRHRKLTHVSHDHLTTRPTFSSLLWMKRRGFSMINGSDALKLFGCLFEQQEKNGVTLKMQD